MAGMPQSLDDALTGPSAIRALVIEDEDIGRRLLRSMLVSTPDVQIVAEARSLAEARHAVAEHRPDLVFMDVEIPGGSAFELLRSLEAPPEVILITGHPEYALPAFDFEVVDFLVKPVRHERLLQSVQRARRRIAESRVTALALSMVGAVATIGREGGSVRAGIDYPSQMTVRVRRRTFWLDVADIVWVQGASQYSRVHAKTGEFLLSRSLSSIESELDPRKFFRIHRSAIVNSACVEEIRSSGDGRYNVYLKGGPVLPMGRSRREILRKLVEGIGRKQA